MYDLFWLPPASSKLSFVQALQSKLTEECSSLAPELSFCVHLNIFHQNFSGPSFLANIHSDLPNSTTDCCFCQMLFTRIHQTLPHLSLVPLLFQTPTPPMSLAEIHEIKVTRDRPRESYITLHNLYSMQPSTPAQGTVLLTFGLLCCRYPFNAMPT